MDTWSDSPPRGSSVPCGTLNGRVWFHFQVYRPKSPLESLEVGETDPRNRFGRVQMVRGPLAITHEGHVWVPSRWLTASGRGCGGRSSVSGPGARGADAWPMFDVARGGLWAWDQMRDVAFRHSVLMLHTAWGGGGGGWHALPGLFTGLRVVEGAGWWPLGRGVPRRYFGQVEPLHCWSNWFAIVRPTVRTGRASFRAFTVPGTGEGT